MQHNKEDIQQMLDKLSEKYNIPNENVSPDIRKEYLELSHHTGKRELLEKEILVLSRALYYPTGDAIMKKRALVILAHSGSVVALKEIAAYLQEPDDHLYQWSCLAFQEGVKYLEAQT